MKRSPGSDKGRVPFDPSAQMPCNPYKPLPYCTTCDRHSPGLPHHPELRKFRVCLDVPSILAKGSACPLYVKRPVLVSWWNNEPETVAA